MTESEHRISTDSGDSLAATLALPDGDPGDGRPAVLLCQGLSGVRTAVMPELARQFAARGIASLRFDYLGCGESDGEPGWVDPAARARQASFALAWLAARKEVDSDRVGVYGHSYGGQTAITLASRESQARAVVSVSGPGSGTDLLRSLRASWDWVAFRHELAAEVEAVAGGAAPRKVGIEKLLPLSPKFMKEWTRLTKGGGGTSAIEKAPELPSYYLLSACRMMESEPAGDASRLGGRPLLMVSGADDDAVPVETARPVYDAAPGPKRWEILPDADHNTLDGGDGLKLAGDHAAAWFEEYLK